MPVQNVPVRNRPIAWPPILLLAAFLRTAHPNNFTLHTALPCVLSNTPTKCEADRMNGGQTDRQTDRQRLLWLLYGATMHLCGCHIGEVKIH